MATRCSGGRSRKQDHYFKFSFSRGKIIKFIFKLAISLKSIILHLKKGPMAQ
jgi:hypothetical protein